MPDATTALAGTASANDPVWERLEDQIGWYDKKSQDAQRFFKRAKVVEMLAAALIPFLAALDHSVVKYATGALGVLVTVIEGILHLNQYQQLWSTYRSTCEALKHERFAFLGNAAPYADAKDRKALLCERVETLVSQEHAQWSSLQQLGQKSANAAQG